MSWESFVNLQKVPLMFADINPGLLGDGLKEIGKSWLKNKNHLILYGSVGTGKTHFSYCLVKALLSKANIGDIIFTTSKAMDDLILKYYKQFGSSEYAIELFKNIPYLIIDDFGVDRSTEKMERDMYDILNSRWGNFKTTVISTNLEASQIEEIYGSRILSRLREWEWIYFGSKDLRGSNKYSEKFNAYQ